MIKSLLEKRPMWSVGLLRLGFALALLVGAYFASAGAAEQAGERSLLTSPILGTLVVQKQTTPNGHPQSFDFNGTFLGSLSDDQSAERVVTAGLYSVTEEVPAGWKLDAITCDDSNSSGDVGLARATYDISEDEIVTCTFYNTRPYLVNLPLVVR